MTKTTNKLILAILAIATAFCLALGIFTAIPAKADGQAVFGIEGAQVRIATDAESDDSGIRFVAQINKTAYDKIVSDANGKTVFFGIELSVGGKSPLSFCYTASNLAGLSGFETLEFASETAIDKFTASITYNEETLAKQLALNAKFNADYDASLSEEENIQAFKDSGLLDKYLETAYKTEITAKAYYQVETTDAEKVYAEGDGIARSIYGVATKAFLDKEDETLFDENGNFALVGKYFASATVLEEAVTVNEYGAITGYEFDEADKVYCGTSSITVTNGKIDKALVSALQDGDVLTLNVIKADGSLITLNATFDMLAEVISTEAIYDATENIIYYTDANGDVVKVTDGTFYYVGDSAVELSKGAVSYWYKDAFVFDYAKYGVANYGMLSMLAPRINDTKVEIAYDPANDVYTGVSVKVENEGMVLYNFTNVVLATAVIDDAAELKEVFNKKDNGGIGTGAKVYDHSGSPYDTASYTYGNITKGMYLLVDDIDASTGFTFENSAFNFFEGVFDGRGHNIYNLNVSGTEAMPGNGLFSAISTYSSIQNVGFIDVKADNGAVFMGNTADRTGGTYVDSSVYRAQVGVTTSGRTDITTVLASVKRSGENYGLNLWSNVYVKVSDDTTKLMGVISRNMPNKVGTVRATNLVIEYNPKDASAYSEGDGGKYGVLFGAAYTVETYGTYLNIYYDVPANYIIYDGNVTAPVYNYYTPTGVETAAWGQGGALNFGHGLTYQEPIGYTIYVISPIKLVSCVKGSILGTNEEVTDENPYKFIAQNYGRHLMRFDNRDTATGLELNKLNGYTNNFDGINKFWNVENQHLVWKNLPAETPVA